MDYMNSKKAHLIADIPMILRFFASKKIGFAVNILYGYCTALSGALSIDCYASWQYSINLKQGFPASF
jgi:hypothetical protein